MPLKNVKTIEDLIWYQYSKIIVKSAFEHENGESAKRENFGLINNKFKELKTGKIKWSDILREDIEFVESEKKCIYCGGTEKITKDHIIPKTFSINEKCNSCDAIQGIHNIIWACNSCNSKKRTKSLYHFYKEIYEGNKKYYDYIPTLLEKKYLKTIYRCHQCNGTLKKKIENIEVLDLDIEY